VTETATQVRDSVGIGEKLYAVRTEQFGLVLLSCENIRQAREWARKRFGVKVPSEVWAVVKYRRCDSCDSKPCCC